MLLDFFFAPDARAVPVAALLRCGCFLRMSHMLCTWYVCTNEQSSTDRDVTGFGLLDFLYIFLARTYSFHGGGWSYFFRPKFAETFMHLMCMGVNRFLEEGFMVMVHIMVVENRPVDPDSIQGIRRPVSFMSAKYGMRANDVS